MGGNVRGNCLCRCEEQVCPILCLVVPTATFMVSLCAEPVTAVQLQVYITMMTISFCTHLPLLGEDATQAAAAAGARGSWQSLQHICLYPATRRTVPTWPPWRRLASGTCLQPAAGPIWEAPYPRWTGWRSTAGSGAAGVAVLKGWSCAAWDLSWHLSWCAIGLLWLLGIGF